MTKAIPVAEGFQYSFRAMGSPCDIRIDCDDGELATRVGEIAELEAFRIEYKYSRYRQDSYLSKLNATAGDAIMVDEETAALLEYAAHCYEISDGMFDITSGVLRQLWQFDRTDRIPEMASIRKLLPFIGWHKVAWNDSVLNLPKGMEIDLGGLGKEYAVDSAILKVKALTSAPVLINFGGDLRVTGPRANGKRWRIALDCVDANGGTEGMLELASGALTTSGDAERFLEKDGVRYSHILNARTGWPVKNPPRSVTVAARTCMEAGVLSTLAMLKGRNAEAFLKREAIQSWVIR